MVFPSEEGRQPVVTERPSASLFPGYVKLEIPRIPLLEADDMEYLEMTTDTIHRLVNLGF
jgi:hypothetical protein